MQAMIIDGQTQDKLSALLAYAETHVIEVDEMLDIYNGDEPPPGDDPNRVVLIDIGYRVVFTHEHQPGGIARHLSVSLDGGRKLPQPAVVSQLMVMLNFSKNIDDCHVLREHIGEGRDAISIIEFL